MVLWVLNCVEQTKFFNFSPIGKKKYKREPKITESMSLTEQLPNRLLSNATAYIINTPTAALAAVADAVV